MNKKNVFLILLLIVLLATFLRFYNIGEFSLWYDEVNYLETRSKNFFEYIPDYIFYKDGIYNNISSPIFTAYSGKGLHVGRPLSPFFFNLWMMFFGTTETALRSFSAILSVFSLIIIFFIARNLVSDKIALLSAFLFAINPYHIFFSQEAVPYSLFILLNLLSLLFFIKSIKENKNIFWIFYILFSVLGMYTDNFFFIMILFQWVFIFVLIKKYKYLIKKFILSQILIALLFAPWIPHFYYANLYAVKNFWLDVLHFIDLPSTLVVFGIGQTLIRKQSSLYQILLVLFFYFIGFIIPFLIGIFPTKLKKVKDIFNGKIEKELFLALYLFVPILFMFVFSILFRPIFQWKYLLFASPAFYILISRGLFKLKKFAYIFLVIIILLTSLSLYNYYSTPIFKGDWRAATEFIQENEKNLDLILIHSPKVMLVFDYYYKGNLPVKGFPDVPYEDLNEENIKITEENIKEIDSVVKGYKRIWLVQRLVEDKEETIPNYLEKKYTRLYYNKFVWVRVYLYQLI